MTQRYYRFAGLEFAVSMPEALAYTSENRLEPFRLDAATDPYRMTLERVEKLTPPEGECLVANPDLRVYRHPAGEIRYRGAVRDSWEEAYLRALYREKEIHVQLPADRYPGTVGTKTVLESMAAEHLTVQNHGFLFHCSYIDRNGKAVLFTAPSETGKSTQADLWNRYRGAEIINGDRAAVRIVDGRIMAEGIPFSGSSQYCLNRSLPVEAIVYLGQAPVTTIRRMRGYEAFARLWEGISVNTWDRKDLELASETVKTVAESVPVFHMPCTPDENAVAVLEEELRKLVNP